MSALAETPGQLMRRIPSMDGHRASEVLVSFSGSGRLDHLNELDLVLLESARLGNEVLLLVRGRVVGKSFALKGRPSDEELSFSCRVAVSSIEDAERA